MEVVLIQAALRWARWTLHRIPQGAPLSSWRAWGSGETLNSMASVELKLPLCRFHIMAGIGDLAPQA